MTIETKTLSGDIALLADGLRGDHEAFDTLFRRHRPYLLRLASRMVRHREEAEDAVQNCLLLAYCNLDSFRQQASFRTWLCRILVNEALSILRKRKIASSDDSRGSMAADGQATWETNRAPQPDPEQALAQKESVMALFRKVSELSPRYRSVLLLCGIHEYTTQEASRVFKVPATTVRSRLFRARKQLALSLLSANIT